MNACTEIIQRARTASFFTRVNNFLQNFNHLKAHRWYKE